LNAKRTLFGGISMGGANGKGREGKEDDSMLHICIWVWHKETHQILFLKE
jgi:hypothetical protein